MTHDNRIKVNHREKYINLRKYKTQKKKFKKTKKNNLKAVAFDVNAPLVIW